MNNVLDKLPDTSIIGGADGPAAIFFAGKLNGGTAAAAIAIRLCHIVASI